MRVFFNCVFSRKKSRAKTTMLQQLRLLRRQRRLLLWLRSRRSSRSGRRSVRSLEEPLTLTNRVFTGSDQNLSTRHGDRNMRSEIGLTCDWKKPIGGRQAEARSTTGAGTASRRASRTPPLSRRVIALVLFLLPWLRRHVRCCVRLGPARLRRHVQPAGSPVW